MFLSYDGSTEKLLVNHLLRNDSRLEDDVFE